ncbi:hypothetical protein Q5P01_000307 [Channa striata]|uniref:Uncharacterized protein n=1 Tax=Channa striata TaxID=64152 RepID=A0AA88IXH3_CHASR|nr:hypothetical protein Q5P01_000307 [Channa striata]
MSVEARRQVGSLSMAASRALLYTLRAKALLAPPPANEAMRGFGFLASSSITPVPSTAGHMGFGRSLTRTSTPPEYRTLRKSAEIGRRHAPAGRDPPPPGSDLFSVLGEASLIAARARGRVAGASCRNTGRDATRLPRDTGRQHSSTRSRRADRRTSRTHPGAAGFIHQHRWHARSRALELTHDGTAAEVRLARYHSGRFKHGRTPSRRKGSGASRRSAPVFAALHQRHKARQTLSAAAPLADALSLCPRTPAAGAVADRGNSPVEVGGFACGAHQRGLAISLALSQQLFRDPAGERKGAFVPAASVDTPLSSRHHPGPLPPPVSLSISRSAFSLSSTRRQPSPLSSMEGPNLCCSLYRALALDPVPVMGEELYVPGAEGVNLKSLREDTLHLCSSHRFNFRRAVAAELIATLGDERCSWRPVADPAPERELPQVRARRVLVYQIERLGACPAYTYRSGRLSLRCSKQRPLTVVDQFNFVADRRPTLKQKPGDGRLPDAITIDAFPGRDNFSALYVIGRRIALPAPEYGNRLFGEAVALGLIDPGSSAKAISREHHRGHADRASAA